MLDFLMVATRSTRQGKIEIYPKFIIKKSKDLMIRGGDFYAIWNEEAGIWSTDEQDALYLIDCELRKYAEENKHVFNSDVRILYMWDAENSMIDSWHKYCWKQMRDSFVMLDEEIIFSNTKPSRKNYSSKQLNYPLEKCDISSYEKLISTLYSPEERHKIEWAIGSIVTGDSKHIQKFLVLYGASGTGKSTILNIIEQLFQGYFAVFDAKALGSSSSTFALEAFKSNPLVALQHDGDLSKIEDNTRLNSLVSHELMTVNEKFKSTYSNRFKCFLFMGTNKPVKITDAKSGLLRRLIDVSPTGHKVKTREYNELIKKVKFELGGIAVHCRDVYLDSPEYYDNYIPINMLGASNDFYNFILDSYFVFKKEDSVTLKVAWEMYKTYCDYAKVPFSFSQRLFKEELKNYFRNYEERIRFDTGERARSYYSGFIFEKFDEVDEPNIETSEDLIIFDSTVSKLISKYPDSLAQYATKAETPISKWAEITSTLETINEKQLHYVRLPETHIVIDFDLKNEKGEKDLQLNIKEASKFPKTYSELSKSGQGIHLHYVYSGDASTLSNIYAEDIEIKVFFGNSALRRKFTKSNGLDIETISSGLPLKGVKNVISKETVTNEKGIRTLILKNLNKEFHSSTKSSIDFINKILEDAYNSGVTYDVTDMKNRIFSFAVGSTNQSKYCMSLVQTMKFKSEELPYNVLTEKPIVFFDIEIFKNLFVLCWKQYKNDKVVKMINPKPKDLEHLTNYNLVGFNNRRYDNHIFYAALLGYSNMELYNLSKKIVSGNRNAFFGEAYNLSYTDVYDFANKKQGLKKWQIELGIFHKELQFPWDDPLDECHWEEVAEYCGNDVISCELVFDNRSADFTARKILAELANSTVNDTTNSLSTKIIFGTNKKPQDQFNYRDLGLVTPDCKQAKGFTDGFTMFNEKNQPVFPGYEFKNGVSWYRGEQVGEGGNVYSEPGMYSWVPVLDAVSMHPTSTVAEQLFGEYYTAIFKEILDARVCIKRKDFDKAKTLLSGVLEKYLTDVNVAKDLAYALKIVINSIYGLTAANFDNPFRDIRNKDNIVAKRGALFMINLRHAVQDKGYKVAHIKTDSIKVPNADQDIIDFIFDYGKLYGYDFEHEETYERFCLVNDAVYIARDTEGHWSATGTQFAVPYVFKTLFSKEEIVFDDLCETKSVTSALYLDHDETLQDVSAYEKLLHLKTAENITLSKTEERLLKENTHLTVEYLQNEVNKGHNYKFIGRVGSFCPVKENLGGGILYRTQGDKYNSVSGTKGYRWLPSSDCTIDMVDMRYYDNLAQEAIKTISKYGDFEEFVSPDDDIPF